MFWGAYSNPCGGNDTAPTHIPCRYCHRQVGLVFQSGALFDSLTVGQNVGFLLHEHTTLPERRIGELVAESLGKVGGQVVGGSKGVGAQVVGGSG